MVHKIDTSAMSREEWLEERRKSIGGSDIGAILGLIKWSSPYTVWANKTGRLPDSEPNEAMRQGTDLEDYVAHRFMDSTGLRVARVNYILRNDDYPHMHANIDRRIVGIKAGLECKTASALSASRFSGGDFPESYYAQCVAYMAITGYQRYYLAVLVLGKEFKVYQMTTEKDADIPEWCESSVYVPPEEFSGLRDAVASFWEYIETDTEPPADMSKATADALAAVHSDPEDVQIDLFSQEPIVEQYLTAKTRVTEAEKCVEMYKNILKQYLGDATSATGDRYTVTWMPKSRTTFDAKRFQSDHPELDLSGYYKKSTYREFSAKEI